MRQLKHHEQKLLRKVSLYSWKGDSNVRESAVLRRYHVSDRSDYVAYSRLCGSVTRLAGRLRLLARDDALRADVTRQLVGKLYDMGVVSDPRGGLKACEGISASAFCRRRLPVVMVRQKMSENLKDAVAMVEQGQVRVGPDVVTDPAFVVGRKMEDFLTWTDKSKIRRTVQKYNEKLDDFDMV